MKIQFPLDYPKGLIPTRKTRAAKLSKDYREAIGALQKEVRLTTSQLGVSSWILVSNMDLGAKGEVYSRHRDGVGVQLKFRYGGCSHFWIIDKYDRTADNIYALSVALHNWRMYIGKGVKSWTENIVV